MSNYHRVYQSGGCYFFTVVAYERRAILNDPNVLSRLRMAFRHAQATRPFAIDAIVVLPDHFHCIWQLPPDDHDFLTRLRLIKHFVSSGINVPVNDRKEKPIWQRRFWEHIIRSEEDWRRHMNYIHYNPVKHGYVKRVADWPYSSFHRAVKEGLYEPDWGIFEPDNIKKMDME